MPEAVASNNISASKRQPDNRTSEQVNADLSDQFEDVREILRAYNIMTCAIIDTGVNQARYTDGFRLIHELIMDRVMQTNREALSQLTDRAGGRKVQKPIDGDLLAKITTIIVTAYADIGRVISDDATKWSDQDYEDVYVSAVGRYNALMSKLRGTDDLLEAGSLLPWLELKIRREIVGATNPLSPELSRALDMLQDEQSEHAIAV